MRSAILAAAFLTMFSQPLAAQPVMLATVGMIADPARRIAGECVTVQTLIGAGLDPHLYQARPSDIRRLRAADRIMALGLSLEGRLAEILARVGAAIIGDAIPADQLLMHNAAPDPHLWMDPALWAETFPAMAEALTALAPDCADDIQQALLREVARALALDAWARESLASIPEAQRVLLTAHDAFTYFSRAYALENEAIQGISTASEPSISGY
ncbi:metal ABC transporter solute-binding protein, Zn/Mn family [Pararhodobacter sp.]|uniref:metal ABC transporter solute-binding protein, Zn/Mn family n=1 Tax=Pararhodobacter sp. TaxID=2127056 RepID=UPI002AFE2264|nr:zinc ABC transporter substrate-binding protein [Pararhodobacter sp.]